MQAVALFAEQLHVPRQSRRVAGDVDHPVRRHFRHGVDDVPAQALARRVQHDHVGPGPFRRQGFGGFSRVGAEKPGVFDAVAAGIVLRVPDGRLHQLHTNDGFCLPRKAQGDGAGTAVEVQNRFRAVKSGGGEGFAVEHLRLVAVDLIKGAGRDAEPQSAQNVLDGIRAPQDPRFFTQHRVTLAGVDVERHGTQLRQAFPQGCDQFFFPGQGFTVDHRADHQFPRCGGMADENMPQQPRMGLFVVGADAVLPRPGDNNISGLVRRFRMDQAALHGDQVMGALAEKARFRPLFSRSYRELCLVPVAHAGFCPRQLDLAQILPAQTVECIQDAPGLDLTLGLIVHVPEIAAAALLGVGAQAVDAVG